jgi:predicted nucleic acid-binding protein
MKIVIDTNRLIAALLRSSVSREIILNDKFDLSSPDIIVSEINKHRKYLIEKSKIKPGEFEIILSTLLEKISMIPFDDFKHEFMNAVNIMRDIDVTDAAFIAVSLASNADGIWTEDKGFSRQKIVKVYSTIDLIELINR